MKKNPSYRQNIAGMSLLEVMLALSIFAMTSLGISSMVIQGQKLAQENVLKNTAYNVAQGYLEQMISINADDIIAAANDSTVPIPTVSVSSTAVGEGNIEVADPLYVGPTNTKEILIDQQEDSEGNITQYMMDMEFVVEVNDMNDASYGTSAIPAIEITLYFNYESRQLKGVNKRAGTLSIVKLNI